MQNIAAAIYNFLMRNNIDPQRVDVVLRSKDAVTQSRLEAAVIHDLEAYAFTSVTSADVRRLRINGISISLTNLDASR